MESIWLGFFYPRCILYFFRDSYVKINFLVSCEDPTCCSRSLRSADFRQAYSRYSYKNSSISCEIEKFECAFMRLILLNRLPILPCSKNFSDKDFFNDKNCNFHDFSVEKFLVVLRIK